MIHGNFLDVDLSPADVVTLYLATDANELLRPNLEKYLRKRRACGIARVRRSGLEAEDSGQRSRAPRSHHLLVRNASQEEVVPAAAYDVVGVGLNATDTLILVPHFPAYGGKVPFEREVLSPGGQVASAMVTCARLGLRAKYIGTVGDDERGVIQLESLRASGVDLDDIEIRTNCPNQSAYILVDQATGERTVFWNRDDCLRIDPDRSRPSRSSARACCTSTDTTRPRWRTRPHRAPASSL